MGCSTRSLAPPASYGFSPCHPLDLQSPRSQAANPSAPHQRQGSHSIAPPPGAAVSGTAFAGADPHGAGWPCPPWCHPSGGIQTPLVAAGWGGMGFEIESGGVKHQYLWLYGIEAGHSEKSRSKTPLSEQGRKRLSRVLWGPWEQDIPPGQIAPGPMDAARAPPWGIHPLHAPFLAKEGRLGATCWLSPSGSAQTTGPFPVRPPSCLGGSLSAERVIPYMMTPDPGNRETIQKLCEACKSMETCHYSDAPSRKQIDKGVGFTRHVLDVGECAPWNVHGLGRKLLATTREHLAGEGPMLKEGTILDAGTIAPPAATKTCKGEGDPEMKQSNKGNQWCCGMKLHIGVDAQTGLGMAW